VWQLVRKDPKLLEIVWEGFGGLQVEDFEVQLRWQSKDLIEFEVPEGIDQLTN
jgi:hypothetical protein